MTLTLQVKVTIQIIIFTKDNGLYIFDEYIYKTLSFKFCFS